jgi:uncharacterized protein YodC (DUF2158 family)
MKIIFKRGDVVTLQSGGPEMTVHDIPLDYLKNKSREDQVVCKWFENETLRSDTFHPNALILVREFVE